MTGSLRITGQGDVIDSLGEIAVRRQDAPDLKCWELMDLRDGAGQSLCSADCPLLQAAGRGEALSSARPAFAGGQLVTVISDTLADASGRGQVVHVITPMRAREDLTPREETVLALLSDGRTNRQIAGVLGVREATIRSHVQHILAKLPAANRVEAVVRAYRGTAAL